jgi:hypothetical protein
MSFLGCGKKDRFSFTFLNLHFLSEGGFLILPFLKRHDRIF